MLSEAMNAVVKHAQLGKCRYHFQLSAESAVQLVMINVCLYHLHCVCCPGLMSMGPQGPAGDVAILLTSKHSCLWQAVT